MFLKSRKSQIRKSQFCFKTVPKVLFFEMYKLNESFIGHVYKGKKYVSVKMRKF
jgi:hypothetical protein